MKRVFSILIAFLFWFNTTVAHSQCAMCRASAESATENVDKGIGEGLNSGILYLMGIPYLLILTVGIVFFRKRIAAFFKS